MTVGTLFGRHVLPNLMTPNAEGFVRQRDANNYHAAGLKTFADAQEVWAHYQDKGTAEERACLQRMLGLADPIETESRLIRRSA